MEFSSNLRERVRDSAFYKRLVNDRQVLVDNSEHNLWNSCFVCGLLGGALKRVNASQRSPLAFGAAVHSGLEEFFKSMDIEKSMAAAFVTAELENLDDLGDPRRNTRVLESLLRGYFLDYTRKPAMRFNLLQINNAPAVEQSFVVPLGTFTIDSKLFGNVEIEILWSGKIDLLTLFEGMIAPVDHKTTTVMGEKFIDDKLRSSQMLGYTYAAKWFADQLFKRPVFGVRINALAMRSSGFEFKQFDIPIADWKVAEWQRETIQSIKQIVTYMDHFLTTGQAVPSREHCVNKYGKCAYFEVCDTVPAMRDRFIFDNNYYYESKWSPLGQ